MIHVFATVRAKPGCLEQVLDGYRILVAEVRDKEPGCVDYLPLVDVGLGLPNQDYDEHLIVVSERWRSIADFTGHLQMAHCVEFRRRIAPYIEGQIRVRVLDEALR